MFPISFKPIRFSVVQPQISLPIEDWKAEGDLAALWPLSPLSVRLEMMAGSTKVIIFDGRPASRRAFSCWRRSTGRRTEQRLEHFRRMLEHPARCAINGCGIDEPWLSISLDSPRRPVDISCAPTLAIRLVREDVDRRVDLHGHFLGLFPLDEATTDRHGNPPDFSSLLVGVGSRQNPVSITLRPRYRHSGRDWHSEYIRVSSAGVTTGCPIIAKACAE